MDSNKIVMVICFNQYIKGLILTIYENELYNPFILPEFDIKTIKKLVDLFHVEEIMLCGPVDFTSKYEDEIKKNITNANIKIIH